MTTNALLPPAGWTPHVGSECPVSRETMVEVQFRTGLTMDEVAGALRWSHADMPGDISAYRVISPAPANLSGTALVERIIRDVAELEPSPSADESHDSMLVTASELQAILEKHLPVTPDIAAVSDEVADNLHIVFEGPPDHDGPRFVEVETADGKSVSAGEWAARTDGYWELRIPVSITADKAEIARLTAERDAAFSANERDRTKVASAVAAITDEVARRSWLCSSRGSYEWDDERYQQEFSQALDAIGKQTDLLREIAGDRALCPVTDAEVQDARINWKARAEAAEHALGHEIKIKSQAVADLRQERRNADRASAPESPEPPASFDPPIFDCEAREPPSEEKANG